MSEWKKKRYRDKREAMDKDRDRDRDLFGELPTHLIHTILSFLITIKETNSPSQTLIDTKGAVQTMILSKTFLQAWSRFPDHCFSQRFIDTKEAVQTMILSKTFLQAWSGFPDLYFFDFAFTKSLLYEPGNGSRASNARNTRVRFANYVLHTITSYQQHNIPIRRLHLTARLREDDGKIANILDQSIRKANEYGIKEVYLHMSFIRPSNFLKTIFATKQLISLSLSWCHLVKKDVQEDSDDIFVNCSSLKVLKLEKVRINEAVLQKLIHSCPLIEEIQIHDCGYKGSEVIEMAHLPNLKRLAVSTIFRQIVDVKVASLELMYVSGSSRLTIGSAWNLKILNLECVYFSDANLHNLISNCCILEELKLTNCDFLYKINVSSHSLRLLSIIVCMELMEVKIDAPVLNLFDYSGNRVLSPLSFANGGSGKRKSSVTLYWFDQEEGPSFLEVSEFLMTLKHTDNVSFFFDTTEISFDRNIMDELRDENNIPEFDEVEIKVYSPSSTYSTIMEGLLWSFSPKIISVKHDSKGADEFIKYLCEELLLQHDDHPKISTSASDCWRNYFKQAKFKNKDRDDEWFPLQSLNSLADVLENLGDHYILKLSRD